MTRLDALVALQEAVKARDYAPDQAAYEADRETLWYCFPTNTPPVSDEARLAARAWKSDMNAALALLAAVLPGWGVTALGQLVEANIGAQDAWTCRIAGRRFRDFVCVEADDPARALLLAIIAALIEGERNAG